MRNSDIQNLEMMLDVQLDRLNGNLLAIDEELARIAEAIEAYTLVPTSPIAQNVPRVSPDRNPSITPHEPVPPPYEFPQTPGEIAANVKQQVINIINDPGKHRWSRFTGDELVTLELALRAWIETNPKESGLRDLSPTAHTVYRLSREIRDLI